MSRTLTYIHIFLVSVSLIYCYLHKIQNSISLRSYSSLSEQYVYIDHNLPKIIGFPKTTTLCSFNIKFLGLYKNKKYKELSNLFNNQCDIIAIQELIAPPSNRCEESYKSTICNNIKQFHQFMIDYGYQHHIAKQGTGKNQILNQYQNNHEWPILYYRSKLFKVNEDKSGYISHPPKGNQKFDRVPYQFQVTSINTQQVWSIVSVHLHAKNKKYSKTKRTDEVYEISHWSQRHSLKSQVILGDFNIKDPERITNRFPTDFLLFNEFCHATNLFHHYKSQCYDHILASSEFQSNRVIKNFHIINIQNIFDKKKGGKASKFSQEYSDHLPILIQWETLQPDHKELK